MTQTAPVLRPGSAASNLLLELWRQQGEGERLVKTKAGRPSQRLAELGMVLNTADGLTVLTEEGRKTAKTLEAGK